MNVICDNSVENVLYSNNFDAGHNIKISCGLWTFKCDEIHLKFLHAMMQKYFSEKGNKFLKNFIHKLQTVT